ncbi:MAG TPA: hypothetical protein VM146_16215 [Steroidobacteraceae bacterium]|nr:hypothetical protein [Steroidobacteraceae bacterium]
MPDYRKPPLQTGGREAPTLPDELDFSIETTTMRLKSLKVRRAEAADKALDDHLSGVVRPTQGKPDAPAPKSAWAQPEPAGRVRHDERGMAVWDWAAAAGETAALSATNVMRKLDVTGLSIEQTQTSLKAMEVPAREQRGGDDPYNQHRPQTGDPFKRNPATGSDPYNRGNLNTPQASRPAPKGPVPAQPVKKAGHSLLDQLTGQKK